jgi:hypothetical protein
MTPYVVGILLMCYSIISFAVWLDAKNWSFNFKENYKWWTALNWPTVIFFTLLLNVLFLPWAVIHWLIRLFYFIFTVGRK